MEQNSSRDETRDKPVMTLEEARAIIAKAKPIIKQPRTATTSINDARKITTFKDFLNYGNSRRKKREDTTDTQTTET